MSEKQKILLAKLLKNCVAPDGSIDGEVLKVILDDDNFEKESGINLDDFVLVPKSKVAEYDEAEEKLDALAQQMDNGIEAIMDQNNNLSSLSEDIFKKLVSHIDQKSNDQVAAVQKIQSMNNKEIEKIVEKHTPSTPIRLS